MLSILFTLALCVMSVLSSPVASFSLEKRADLLGTVNGWRYAYGKPALRWSQDLAGTAASTGQANGGGVSMNHHPCDKCAEVISPGSDHSMGKDLKGRTPFDLVMLKGFLCEVPGDQQLQGACNDFNDLMPMKYDTTGHHDIVLDTRYKTVGCAYTPNSAPGGYWFQQGQWVCELGF
ncbi:MAG: hypothetical protein Q9174_001308 [Haloplaca sp. 1 TL-2023]